MKSRFLTKEQAVAEVMDEILVRHHGILTSANHAHDFLDWLQERGYKIVKIREGDHD